MKNLVFALAALVSGVFAQRIPIPPRGAGSGPAAPVVNHRCNTQTLDALLATRNAVDLERLLGAFKATNEHGVVMLTPKGDAGGNVSRSQGDGGNPICEHHVWLALERKYGGWANFKKEWPKKSLTGQVQDLQLADAAFFALDTAAANFFAASDKVFDTARRMGIATFENTVKKREVRRGTDKFFEEEDFSVMAPMAKVAGRSLSDFAPLMAMSIEDRRSALGSIVSDRGDSGTDILVANKAIVALYDAAVDFRTNPAVGPLNGFAAKMGYKENDDRFRAMGLTRMIQPSLAWVNAATYKDALEIGAQPQNCALDFDWSLRNRAAVYAWQVADIQAHLVELVNKTEPGAGGLPGAMAKILGDLDKRIAEDKKKKEDEAAARLQVDTRRSRIADRLKEMTLDQAGLSQLYDKDKKAPKDAATADQKAAINAILAGSLQKDGGGSFFMFTAPGARTPTRVPVAGDMDTADNKAEDDAISEYAKEVKKDPWITALRGSLPGQPTGTTRRDVVESLEENKGHLAGLALAPSGKYDGRDKEDTAITDKLAEDSKARTDKAAEYNKQYEDLKAQYAKKLEQIDLAYEAGSDAHKNAVEALNNWYNGEKKKIDDAVAATRTELGTRADFEASVGQEDFDQISRFFKGDEGMGAALSEITAQKTAGMDDSVLKERAVARIKTNFDNLAADAKFITAYVETYRSARQAGSGIPDPKAPWISKYNKMYPHRSTAPTPGETPKVEF